MSEDSLIGRFMVVPDGDLEIPVEQRIVRVDGITDDPDNPYRVMDFDRMAYVTVPDDFEREATKEEMDSIKESVGKMLGAAIANLEKWVAKQDAEEEPAANAETSGRPVGDDAEVDSEG